MSDWLNGVVEQVAARHGLDASGMTLSGADQRAILDVARIASHASGQRTNAPLLAYILGLMRAQGVPVADLAASVREVAGDPDAPVA